jgi:hypothetical protein
MTEKTEKKDEKKKGAMPPKVITTQKLPNRPGNYRDRQISSDNVEKH